MKNIQLIAIIGVATSILFAAGCATQPPPQESAPPAQMSTPPVETAETAPAPHEFDAMPAVGTNAHCPVMDKPFVVAEATESSTIDGKTYVFCCSGCKEKFDADPSSYLTKL